MQPSSDVAFTPAVKRIQSERGSRAAYTRLERLHGGFETEITPELAAFLAERTSAYLATANAAGHPYVQHRGGPPGFLRILGPRTLAFADFIGNKQYITTGNLSENERAFLFVMDYERRRRMKLWGRARVANDPGILAKVSDPAYPARVEQAIVFEIDAWDANCPQHIPHLVPVERVAAEVDTLRRRVATLEAALRDAGRSVPD